MEYEAREKAILDHKQFLLEAEQRGKKQKAISIAINMKAENIPDDMISRLTGLSISEITGL